MSDTEEADRFEDYPHPRERDVLIGHTDAEKAFLDAYRGGRLHHAWIIGGPEGIGKATLAYRIARFLFAHPDPAAAAVQAARDLSVDPAHSAFRKVQSLGHADLVLLRRTENDKGTLRTEIAVDQVRRATELFEATAGEGGWRICIIDSADELNRNSANALLKSLEEPPPRSLFLIIAHAPGRLLPTIRSRGRLITLAPLSEEDLTRVVGGLVDEDSEAVAVAVKRADGSVRRALSLLDPDLSGVGDRTRALLDGLPALPSRALLDLAGKTSGRAGEAIYEEVLGATRAWMSDLLRRHAGEGAWRLQPLSELWEKMQEDARMVDALNLDKRPFIIGLFSDMADAVARLRPARTP